MTSNDLAFIEFDPKSPELSYLDEDKKLSYTPECLKRFIELGANKVFDALKLKVSDQDREAILHIIEKGLIKKEELNDGEKALLFCLWNEKSFWNSFLKEIFNKKMLYTSATPLGSEYVKYIEELDKIISSFQFDTSLSGKFINSNHTPSKLLWKIYSKRSNDGKYFYFENGEIKPLVLRYEGKEFFPKLSLDTDKEETTLPTGESFQEAYIHQDEGRNFYFLLDKNLQPIQYQLDGETYFLNKVSYYEPPTSAPTDGGYCFLYEISKKLLRVEFRKFTGEAVKSMRKEDEIQLYVTEDMKPVEYQHCGKTYCLKKVFDEKNIGGKSLYHVWFGNSNYDNMRVYLTEDLQPWKKTIGGEEYLLTDLSVRNKENIGNLFKATFLNEQGEEIQCYLTLEGEILSYVNQNGKKMLVENLEKVHFMSGTDLEKPLIFIAWTGGGTPMLANEEKSGEGNKEELGEANEEELGNKKFGARIRNFFNRKK